MMDRWIRTFRPGGHVTQRRFSVLLAACLLAACLSVAPAVSAQDEQIRLAIVPVGTDGGYFDLTLEPGETRELSVQLSNRGPATLSVRTYPADAYTIINGGFGARLAGEPVSGVTSWIDYRDETLELRPTETVVRSFTVSVPEDAQPGQYLTSLAIQNAEPIGDSSGAGVGFNQVIRQTIALAIRVPGPDAPAFQIGQASHAMVSGTSVISIEVFNTGNVHLVPHGEFRLTDATGAEAAELRIQMATVYSGTSTLVEAPLPHLLEAGEYVATLVLRDDTYDIQAESGLLALSIPPLHAPVQAAVETGGDVPLVSDVRVIVVPDWAMAAAVPLAVIVGMLFALGAVVGLRGRTTPARDIVPHYLVTSESAPQARKPATIRPLIPPARAAALEKRRSHL